MFNPPDGAPRLGILRLPEDQIGRALVRRLLFAIGLIVAVAVFLWFDRDGLQDNAHPDRAIRFIDVFYFTVVSLTTVGYGDIVPVTSDARFINAVLLTPIRIFLWAVFLGTAYEITVLRLRLREERRMRELHNRLHGHVIVCGYGVKGRAIVEELRAHDERPDEIVIIDESEEAVTYAAKQGLVALRGDATTEALLNAASVQEAAWVLVAPHRDDAAVLICLTVRSLAPKVELIAAAREEENIKLLYRAGADLVVAPSVAGGKLMATAVRQQAVPHFMEDLLTFGEGLSVNECVVSPDDIGKSVAEAVPDPHALVLGVVRGDRRWRFHQLREFRLEVGDIIVYLTDEVSEKAS
jgi:voltage-gated potassium channel